MRQLIAAFALMLAACVESAECTVPSDNLAAAHQQLADFDRDRAAYIAWRDEVESRLDLESKTSGLLNPDSMLLVESRKSIEALVEDIGVLSSAIAGLDADLNYWEAVLRRSDCPVRAPGPPAWDTPEGRAEALRNVRAASAAGWRDSAASAEAQARPEALKR